MNQKNNFHSEVCSQNRRIFLLLYVSHISSLCFQFGAVQLCGESFLGFFFVYLFVFCLSAHPFFPLVQNEGAVRNTHNSLNVKPHLCAFFSWVSVNVNIAVVLQGFWRVPCPGKGCEGAGRWCLLLGVILLLYQTHFLRLFFFMFSQYAGSNTCRCSF